MSKLVKILFISVMVLYCNSTVFSQEVGTIFTKSEANSLLGKAVESVKIPKSQITDLMSKSVRYLMFRIVAGELKILGDNRKPLYPSTDIIIDKNDPYYVASISKLKQLLDNNQEDFIYIETREKAFSITYGNSTLDSLPICPPICFESLQ